MTAEELASAAGEPEEIEWSYMILEHLSANNYHGIKKTRKAALMKRNTQFKAIYYGLSITQKLITASVLLQARRCI